MTIFAAPQRLFARRRSLRLALLMPGCDVAAGAPRDTQRNWQERAAHAASVPANQPANSRHAAITRSLNSWSNYKNWTDKVRSSWDKDKGGK